MVASAPPLDDVDALQMSAEDTFAHADEDDRSCAGILGAAVNLWKDLDGQMYVR